VIQLDFNMYYCSDPSMAPVALHQHPITRHQKQKNACSLARSARARARAPAHARAEYRGYAPARVLVIARAPPGARARAFI
jgi:hypothetical protein